MGHFAILTNRKRAIVALVHSLVFLLIAFRQMIAPSPAEGIWRVAAVPTGTWILCTIFVIVSAILILLFAISRARIERLYFGLCAISATSGLLRTAAGDQAFHAGLYIRVVMLTSAVLVGWLIVRLHSNSATVPAAVDNSDSDPIHSGHECPFANLRLPLAGRKPVTLRPRAYDLQSEICRLQSDKTDPI